MELLKINPYKKIDLFKKSNKNILVDKNNKISSLKNANSFINPFAQSLEMQGRFLVNGNKISFRGNNEESELEFCLKNTDLVEGEIRELLQLTSKQKKEAVDLYEEGIFVPSVLCEVVKNKT